MKVSVIIPSYNGAHKILNALNAIEKQVYRPFEVIVVIDGSTDNTVALLKKKEFRFHHFKIIEQANGGRAKVRNRGAAGAAGDVLVFFDDDMRPSPECLEVHVHHHLQHPGTILTGAQIEEVTELSSDMIRFKASLSNKWTAKYATKESKPLTEEQIFITAANFSISKNTFDLLDGFDERLTDAEDYDLGVRAFKKGIPLYINLAAHAWHDDNINCTTYIKRLRQYKIANQKLQKLRPDLHSKNKFITPDVKGLKKIAFYFFAHKFWIKLVDKTQLLMMLPKTLRYKIYDMIVTANGTIFSDKIKL